MESGSATIIIPSEWGKINFNKLSGILMIIGAPDTGKSTLARFLFQRLIAAGLLPAYLDGDPGQSSLGPPATITAALAAGTAGSPPAGLQLRWFVGAVSPLGHMLPLLAGTARLAEAMRQAGAEAVVHDTSGLIDPQRGGCTLKWAKIDLLRPVAIFALQRRNELQPLLAPLRRRNLRLFEFSPAPEVRRRDTGKRREHRCRMFRAHFAGATDLSLARDDLAIYPGPAALQPGRLVSLEDQAGFTLALGVVGRNDLAAGWITVRAPAVPAGKVKILRAGGLLLDPDTFREQPSIVPISRGGREI